MTILTAFFLFIRKTKLMYILFFLQNIIFAINIYATNLLNNNYGIIIPPAFKMPKTDYLLASVNQYIISPIQGGIHVYYTGNFNNINKDKKARILLALPDGSTDIIVEASGTIEGTEIIKKNIVVNTQLQKDVNEIRAEFNLFTKTDLVKWHSSKLKFLPGLTIIMLHSNIAALKNYPQDFIKVPKAQQQFVRIGGINSPFPQFEISHILPSRFFLKLITLFFSCVFMLFLLLSLRRLKKQRLA